METPPGLYYDLKWHKPDEPPINDRSRPVNTYPSLEDRNRTQREAAVTEAKLQDPEFVFSLYCSIAYAIPGFVFDGLPSDYRERFEALNGHVEKSLARSPNGEVHAALPALKVAGS